MRPHDDPHSAPDTWYVVTGVGVRRPRHGLDPVATRPTDGTRADPRSHVGRRGDQPVRAAGARRAAGGERGRRRQRRVPLRARRARSRSVRRRCWRCASATSASWAGSCTSRPSTRRTSTSCCATPGEPHGIANVGYRAIDTLRMEKGYLYWSTDITPDTTPWEAGLELAGQPAQGRLLRARRAGGAARRRRRPQAVHVHARADGLPGQRRGDHRRRTRSSASRPAPTSATPSASRSPTATCRSSSPTAPTS